MGSVDAIVPQSAEVVQPRAQSPRCKPIEGLIVDQRSVGSALTDIEAFAVGALKPGASHNPMPPLRIGNECRTCQAAALFVDIVDYTRMSESLSSVEMLGGLQWFYDSMTKVTQLCGGCVERYDGDALFVTFGTRPGDGQIATAALHCAFEMNAIVGWWRRNGLPAGQAAIDIGIGIDLGPITVAELSICGERTRTLQGDAINVARKLEALTRELDAGIVASNRLVKAALEEGHSDQLVAKLKQQAPRKVGGRIAPVGLWALNGTRQAAG